MGEDSGWVLSPQNAIIVGDRVEKAVALLQQIPTGHQGRVTGTYEKRVQKTSLIIVYTLQNKADLTIVRVIHTAQNWKDESWPE
jgi:plasmid stabilization system protein ParE